MSEIDEALDQAELDRVYDPSMLLDQFNPANDEYFAAQRRLRGLAVSCSMGMRQRHVHVAKALHAGKRPTDIAEELGLEVGTVYTVSRRDDVLKLRTILEHLAHLDAGPSIEHRKHVLYRITRRNEVDDPNIAISAIREMNKMDGAYTPPAQQQAPAVNITINQELMPRTALDAQHE